MLIFKATTIGVTIGSCGGLSFLGNKTCYSQALVSPLTEACEQCG